MIDEMVHPLGYYHFSAVPPLNAALSLSLSLSARWLNPINTERVAPF